MTSIHFYVDQQWRGGLRQAKYTFRGLGERQLQAELVAARSSPLAMRSREAGIAVHDVARFGLRARAAAAVRKLLSKDSFDLVHLNEPHALTAAWLADAHKKLPLLLSRRIGFPLKIGRAHV